MHSDISLMYCTCRCLWFAFSLRLHTVCPFCSFTVWLDAQLYSVLQCEILYFIVNILFNIISCINFIHAVSLISYWAKTLMVLSAVLWIFHDLVLGSTKPSLALFESVLIQHRLQYISISQCWVLIHTISRQLGYSCCVSSCEVS